MSENEKQPDTNGNRTAGNNDALTGKFVAGNQAAVGRSHRRERAQAFTDAIQAAVSPEHIAMLIRVLLKKALEGDVRAASEVLDRLVGKAVTPIEFESAECPRIKLICGNNPEAQYIIDNL